jgi:hypothetical protein
MFDTYAKYIATLSEAQKLESKMTEAHWPPPDAKELHLDRWSVISILCVLLGNTRLLGDSLA